jgi:hypothetical protein
MKKKLLVGITTLVAFVTMISPFSQALACENGDKAAARGKNVCMDLMHNAANYSDYTIWVADLENAGCYQVAKVFAVANEEKAETAFAQLQEATECEERIEALESLGITIGQGK